MHHYRQPHPLLLTAATRAGLASHLRSLRLYAHWVLFDSSEGSCMFLDSRNYEPDRGLHSLLQQALPQLRALTRLEVDEVADASLFKHAPPQLLELHSVGVDDQSDT